MEILKFNNKILYSGGKALIPKLKDGIFLIPKITEGDEYRYKVEVWQDGKMLFPKYDERIPGRNFIKNSRLDNLLSWRSVVGVPTIVNDSNFGNVLQCEIINSGLASNHPILNKSTLLNTDLVYYVIAKRVSETGSFSFGGWRDTIYNLSFGKYTKRVDLGNGWFLYWITFESEDEIAGDTSSLHLNTMSGTWQIYAVGLNKGTEFYEWTPAPEELLELSKITTTNCSYKIENDELVLFDFTEETGTVNVEVSYGKDWVRNSQVSWEYIIPEPELNYIVINGLKWMKENFISENGDQYFSYSQALDAIQIAGYRLPTDPEILAIRFNNPSLTWDNELKGVWAGEDHTLKSDSVRSLFFPAWGWKDGSSANPNSGDVKDFGVRGEYWRHTDGNLGGYADDYYFTSTSLQWGRSNTGRHDGKCVRCIIPVPVDPPVPKSSYILINGKKWSTTHLVKEDGDKFFTQSEAKTAVSALGSGYRLPTSLECDALALLGYTWDEDRSGMWVGEDHFLKINSEKSLFFPAWGSRDTKGVITYETERSIINTHQWSSDQFYFGIPNQWGLYGNGNNISKLAWYIIP